MPWLPSLLLVLVASPIAVFVVHAIAYRVLVAIGARPTAHSSAALAIAGTFAPVFASAWLLDVSACGFVYTAVVYAAIAILYIDVVNIAETSLHMHLLLELAWTGGVDLGDLLDRYSADRMIAARVGRLVSIGQLRVIAGRCYVGNRSALHLNRALDAWRAVLGLPTSPPQLATEPRSVPPTR